MTIQRSISFARMAVLPLLATLAATPDASAQVTFYDLYYVANFNQADEAPPTAPTSYAASLRLWQADPGNVAAASVRAPDGSRRTLTPIIPECLFWGQYWIMSEEELLEVLPAGRYDFAASGGTLGTQSGSLTSPPAPRWPTSIPWIRNFDELRVIVPNRRFTIRLVPWTSPSADFRTTYLSISSNDGALVYQTTAPHTASEVEIPASILQSETQYTLRIDFSAGLSAPRAGFGGTATSIVAWDRSTYAVIETTTYLPCRADVNEDGFLDLFDYLDFAVCFDGDGCPSQNADIADFNRDGFVDFFDYTDFVTAFERGC